MRRVLCPGCGNRLVFDESRYPEGKGLAFVCPQCGHRFKVKVGRKTLPTGPERGKEAEVSGFPAGYITVIENAFAFGQKLPLAMGDNVIGRRNPGTEGVNVPIETADPSMGRKHCVINVREGKDGKRVYTLRDFPSLTGTFLGNTLIGEKERVRIEDGAVVTLGATTFIFHEPEKEE